MTKTLRCALGVLLAACGGGDDGNDPLPDGSDEVVCGDGVCTEGQENSITCLDDCITSPNCGDGTCGSDENCGLCGQDCGVCAPVCGDRTCNGDETCTSCENDCGCGEDQVCREDACVPISTNPLIESMPGEWVQVEPEPSGGVTTVSVDPNQPTCDDPQQTPGDACIRGFGNGPLVLSGMRIFVDVPGYLTEGQVLNDGTRVDFDYTELEGYHFIYDKLP